MLERPDLSDAAIRTALRRHYGREAAEIAFLPLGADPDSAAFKALCRGGETLFVKLRLGQFDPASVAIPALLAAAGIREVISPFAARDGESSARIGDAALIVYPFVDAVNAVGRPLSRQQWTIFGSALRRIHATALPDSLARLVRAERYSAHFRSEVQSLISDRRMQTRDEDPISRDLMALLGTQAPRIKRLVERTGALATQLAKASPASVLCHTDIHATNLLIADDGIHIVDWDQPRLAPRERDLMFIGGGVCGVWNRPEEADWFFEGYGETRIDRAALAYFRGERVIEDIAVIAEQILRGRISEADRRQNLGFLAASFAPGNVLEIAEATDA